MSYCDALLSDLDSSEFIDGVVKEKIKYYWLKYK